MKRGLLLYWHAITWADGDFERTASLLTFRTCADRDAFALQSEQRFEPISAAQMRAYERDGLTRTVVTERTAA